VLVGVYNEDVGLFGFHDQIVAWKITGSNTVNALRRHGNLGRKSSSYKKGKNSP
jgi:hypothetical protein